jgi:hypothetical protein
MFITIKPIIRIMVRKNESLVFMLRWEYLSKKDFFSVIFLLYHSPVISGWLIKKNKLNNKRNNIKI